MSTVRIYKSTDPGAPPHPSSTRGSMAALLRACLVTGWTSGDFTAIPAGWEEPYPETNNKACFRALQGTARLFYQINDQDYDADVTRMTQYDSMSDAENGIGERGAVYFGKWYNAAESQHWYVIADETTCYVWLDSQDSGILHGFGEYVSLINDDPCPAFIAGHNDSSQLANDDTTVALHSAKPIYDTAWQAGYVRRGIASDSPSRFSALGYGSNVGIGGNADYKSRPVAGVALLALPVVIKAINDVTAGVYQPCGLLRGLYFPLFSAPYNAELTLGDKTLLSVALDYGATDGKCLIDLGSWDA